MASLEPLYLGFDLSTQQLKGLAITSGLKVQYEAKFDFDDDSTGFDVKKGVITNEDEHEVYAPVALWLQAIDKLLGRLEDAGIDFSMVKGISGAGQQHGSVYWSEKGEHALRNLDKDKSLEEQLDHAFSHPFSPNWQDASTQKECDAFDKELGSAEQLAQCTGSKAHHRFTGPQILRFQRRHQEAYKRTSHISLVSSFLASIFLGEIAPCDVSDVCGMNLRDVQAGAWSEKLVALASGYPEDATELKLKLGHAFEDGGGSLGTISPYFVQKYNFHPSCSIAPFTGDNPATLLALPLQPSDAIVSLGTSTTFLMSTPYYRPDPAVHFFNHPTTAGLYMFMLCYKNGGLARELIRDAINTDSIRQELISKDVPPKSWVNFDKIAIILPILGQLDETDDMKMGLYFPRPEIVPNVRAGEWRYLYNPYSKALREVVLPADGWIKPDDDARAIVESQLLSLRLRSRDLVQSPGDGLPPQPRRIYLVGGGSQNAAIAKIAGEVLGGSEGVYKLDVGQNACALGAAYKAVWAAERRSGETFEDFIGARWKEDEFVEKIAEGYQKGVFERYGQALEGFARMEKQVLEQDRRQQVAP